MSLAISKMNHELLNSVLGTVTVMEREFVLKMEQIKEHAKVWPVRKTGLQSLTLIVKPPLMELG